MRSNLDLRCPHSRFSENGDTLNEYLKDVRKYDVLTPEEEVELFIKIEQGDQEARNKVINSNLRFVYAVAKRFSNGSNLLDLIQVGNIGLMLAIDKFDYRKTGKDGGPMRFISYAVWYIRREICFYVLNDNLVRKTNNVKTTLKANKIKNDFYAENGRVPTAEEIAEAIEKEYGIPVKDISYLYDVDTKHLESSFGDDKKETFENSSLFNEKSASYNEYNNKIEEEENAYKVENCLQVLDDREREVIIKLHGIKMDRPLTMDEVAKKLGITKERVRQIKLHAISKMRKAAAHKA